MLANTELPICHYSVSHMLTNLLLTNHVWHRYNYLHFTAEDTEAQSS